MFSFTEDSRELNTDDFVWLPVRQVANFLLFSWDLVCTPGLCGVFLFFFFFMACFKNNKAHITNKQNPETKICVNLSSLFKHFVLAV